MKRISFSRNCIYHIYNRGVEKRNTFTEEKDYLRFLSDLQQFNNPQMTLNNGRAIEQGLIGVRLQSKKLVEILAFCLMPNHYHLMLRQKMENGITEFMHKMGTGYTNYFNLRYNRVGPLFQGKFKAVLLKKENHFLYLPHYIHANPLELAEENKKNMDFLKTYRWSSLFDYLEDKKTSLPTIDRKFLLECSGGIENFINSLKETIENPKMQHYKDITIDCV